MSRQAEAEPAGGFAGHDDIDERIDVGAQYALLRLSKDGPDERTDAQGLLGAVKSGALAGIYGDDLGAAARLADRLGTVRWTLVPPGEDAALVQAPDDAVPTIIFREKTRSDRTRLDPALRHAWAAFTARGNLPACPEDPNPEYTLLESQSGVGPVSGAGPAQACNIKPEKQKKKSELTRRTSCSCRPASRAAYCCTSRCASSARPNFRSAGNPGEGPQAGMPALSMQRTARGRRDPHLSHRSGQV